MARVERVTRSGFCTGAEHSHAASIRGHPSRRSWTAVSEVGRVRRGRVSDACGHDPCVNCRLHSGQRVKRANRQRTSEFERTRIKPQATATGSPASRMRPMAIRCTKMAWVGVCHRVGVGFLEGRDLLPFCSDLENGSLLPFFSGRLRRPDRDFYQFEH